MVCFLKTFGVIQAVVYVTAHLQVANVAFTRSQTAENDGIVGVKIGDELAG